MQAPSIRTDPEHARRVLVENPHQRASPEEILFALGCMKPVGIGGVREVVASLKSAVRRPQCEFFGGMRITSLPHIHIEAELVGCQVFILQLKLKLIQPGFHHAFYCKAFHGHVHLQQSFHLGHLEVHFTQIFRL